jgi:hypothetical protein
MVRGTGALDALAVSLTSFLKVAKNRHVAFPSLALHTIAVTMTGNTPSFKVRSSTRHGKGDGQGRHGYMYRGFVSDMPDSQL